MALLTLVQKVECPRYGRACPSFLVVFFRDLDSDWRAKTKAELSGPISLHRTRGYRLQDFMSKDLVLREAGLRKTTCIVRERQERFYGHAARLLQRTPHSESCFLVIRELDHAKLPPYLGIFGAYLEIFKSIHSLQFLSD